jgi:hypothetical protein
VGEEEERYGGEGDGMGRLGEEIIGRKVFGLELLEENGFAGGSGKVEGGRFAVDETVKK